MLNNEFRLIGTIVEDFKKTGSDKFPKFETKIEVEKKSKGKASPYTLVVLGTNNVIDTSKSLKGKKVIAFGYIDVYKDYLSLVLQDFEVIGSDTLEVEDIVVPKVVLTEDEDDSPVHAVPTEEIDLPDDDLPF